MLIDYFLIKYEIWSGISNDLHLAICVITSLFWLVVLVLNFTPDLIPKTKISLWVTVMMYLLLLDLIWALGFYLLMVLLVAPFVFFRLSGSQMVQSTTLKVTNQK